MQWTQQQYQDFAKRYITKRLSEGKHDAIEEMSAYLGIWMWQNDRAKEVLREFDEAQARSPD